MAGKVKLQDKNEEVKLAAKFFITFILLHIFSYSIVFPIYSYVMIWRESISAVNYKVHIPFSYVFKSQNNARNKEINVLSCDLNSSRLF